MIATPDEIRKGIALNIERSIKGMQATPYPIANPTLPSCYVEEGMTRYDGAMGRGHDEMEFLVVAMVSLAVPDAALRKLAEFKRGMGPQSLKQAIESDRTLGGIVDTLRVTESSKPQTYTFETVTAGAQRAAVHGAEWSIVVLAGNY